MNYDITRDETIRIREHCRQYIHTALPHIMPQHIRLSKNLVCSQQAWKQGCTSEHVAGENGLTKCLCSVTTATYEVAQAVQYLSSDDY